MPELPEVETSCRGIAPHMTGHKVTGTVVRNTRLRWPVADEVISLKNEKVKSVQRRAKYLLIEVESGWMIVHLGMSGNVRILPQETPADKHDHVELHLDNGMMLRYHDPRRFGAWLWCDALENSVVLSKLGPEPLSDDFNADYLFEKISNKKTEIKPLLMDNGLVVGIGNIYASESLFVAKIHPTRPADSLSKQEIICLVNSIKGVLKASIEQGGTTLKDFLQSDGKPGYFAQQLRVYGQAGKNCPICQGKIETMKHRQRTSFFCPNCQK